MGRKDMEGGASSIAAECQHPDEFFHTTSPDDAIVLPSLQHQWERAAEFFQNHASIYPCFSRPRFMEELQKDRIPRALILAVCVASTCCTNATDALKGSSHLVIGRWVEQAWESLDFEFPTLCDLLVCLVLALYQIIGCQSTLAGGALKTAQKLKHKLRRDANFGRLAAPTANEYGLMLTDNSLWPRLEWSHRLLKALDFRLTCPDARIDLQANFARIRLVTIWGKLVECMGIRKTSYEASDVDRALLAMNRELDFINQRFSSNPAVTIDHRLIFYLTYHRILLYLYSESARQRPSNPDCWLQAAKPADWLQAALHSAASQLSKWVSKAGDRNIFDNFVGECAVASGVIHTNGMFASDESVRVRSLADFQLVSSYLVRLPKIGSELLSRLQIVRGVLQTVHGALDDMKIGDCKSSLIDASDPETSCSANRNPTRWTTVQEMDTITETETLFENYIRYDA